MFTIIGSSTTKSSNKPITSRTKKLVQANPLLLSSPTTLFKILTIINPIEIASKKRVANENLKNRRIVLLLLTQKSFSDRKTHQPKEADAAP